MSNDNHQQSVGGDGAIDGISGSDNPGTEGADSGQGINQGKNKETDANRPGHGDDGQHRGGKSDQHGGDQQDAGLVRRGGNGASSGTGNIT